MKNYDELVRKSIRRDFIGATFKRLGRAIRIPHAKNIRRIIRIATFSSYYPISKYFVGRLVRLRGEGVSGGCWVEFLNEEDRVAANRAGGFPETKFRYLLQGVKFDD